VVVGKAHVIRNVHRHFARAGAEADVRVAPTDDDERAGAATTQDIHNLKVVRKSPLAGVGPGDSMSAASDACHREKLL